jgi:hypothetical protein
MRQSIGKGVVRNLLGSPGRQLSEGNCPAVGSSQRSMGIKYGTFTNSVGYVQNGPGGPIQVWADFGGYRTYQNNGPMVQLRPYGRWRISINLNVLHRKVGIGDSRDILKCNLVRFRTDIDGNPIGAPDLIQKNGNQGVVLDGIPAGAESTWTWDLTTGPFVFNDFLDISEQDAYCFIGFDAIFISHDPQPYISGTLAGIQPYNTVPGGNSNSDPLALFNTSGVVFTGPPPPQPGDWDLPIEPFLANGVVPVDGSFGGSTSNVMFGGLDGVFGPGGWGASRPTWTADFTAHRLSLAALFAWAITSGKTVTFSNKTLTQGFAVAYLWTFGDGATSTAQNPAHTYPASGSFNAKLTATDNLGLVSEFDQVVLIPLKANFSISGFTGVNAHDLSIGAVTWDWDWGDGSPHSTTQNPSHSYARGLHVTITLTISDGAGKFDSISKPFSTPG